MRHRSGMDRPREGDHLESQWFKAHENREGGIEAQGRKHAVGSTRASGRGAKGVESYRQMWYQRQGVIEGRERMRPFDGGQAREVPNPRPGGPTRGRLDVRSYDPVGGPTFNRRDERAGRPLDINLKSGDGGGRIMQAFKERNGGRLPKERGYDQFNAGHVEAQAAAYMSLTGRRNATLYVNRKCENKNPQSCDARLPYMLDPGSRLTVYGPDGFVKVYRGKSELERRER